MPLPPLPKQVRVGYLTYAIKPMSDEVSEAGKMMGHCDNSEALIRIWTGSSAHQAANTLLHEILHACWHVGSLGDVCDDRDVKEEIAVSIFSNQLSQVWRDNPDVIAWITERLHGPADG
jgi:hypothetical protein